MIVPFAGTSKAGRLSNVLGKFAGQSLDFAMTIVLNEKSWQDNQNPIIEAGRHYDSVRCILESCVCLGSMTSVEESLGKLDDLITRYGRISQPFDLERVNINEWHILLSYHGADILRSFIKTGTMTHGRIVAFEQVFGMICERESIATSNMSVRNSPIIEDFIPLYWLCRLLKKNSITIGSKNAPFLNKSLSANDSLSEVVRVCWMMNALLVQPDNAMLRQEIRLHTLLSLLFWFKGVGAGRNWISILPVFMLFVVSGFFLNGVLPTPSGVISDMALSSLTENLRKMGYKGKF